MGEKNKKYVYLLSDFMKDNVFKIGVTKGEINKRIKELQTGNSGEIIIANYFETEHPFYLEKRLHMHFGSKKILGEWYQLSSDDVKSFKSICEEIEKQVEVLKDNPFFPKNLK